MSLLYFDAHIDEAYCERANGEGTQPQAIIHYRYMAQADDNSPGVPFAGSVTIPLHDAPKYGEMPDMSHMQGKRIRIQILDQAGPAVSESDVMVNCAYCGAHADKSAEGKIHCSRGCGELSCLEITITSH